MNYFKAFKTGLVVCCITVCLHGYAQDKTTVPMPVPSLVASKADSQVLPGNGLYQHDFLYTGEWDYRKTVQTIYLVHKGKVAWSYDIPFSDPSGNKSELGDATMRGNGNIVFCRKLGASEVTPEKKIIWNYDAPKGTEIHSVEPIGSDRVLMVINGVPARVMMINIKNGKVENEFTLPTGKPGPHLQFRRVRITPQGTILAAHLDSNVVTEYDMKGKAIWSVKTGPAWSAIRLKNGNSLVTTNKGSYFSEINPKGEVVWDISQADIPGIKLYQLQVAVRLDNGNTIFSNWCVNGIKDPQDWPKSVQLIEVTPQKKVVWAMSQWKDPDMGPASSIQLLDNMDLDKIKAYRVESDSAIGKVEVYDNSVRDLIDSHAAIEVIGRNYKWSEGPVWVASKQMLLFSAVRENKIYRWNGKGEPAVYLSPSGYTDTAYRDGENGSNGLTLDRDGKLLLCQSGNRQVVRMNAPLDDPKPDFTVLAAGYHGKKFNSPNDLIADSKNNIYFTDPIYGLPKGAEDPTRELNFEGVYKITADGKLILLIDSISRPNGIALSADENILYVGSSDDKHTRWYAYHLDSLGAIQSGGILLDGTALKERATVKQGADGFKIDKHGNIFSAGPDGINIISPSGKLLGLIKVYNRPASNCAFNEMKDVLYFTASDLVLKIRLR